LRGGRLDRRRQRRCAHQTVRAPTPLGGQDGLQLGHHQLLPPASRGGRGGEGRRLCGGFWGCGARDQPSAGPLKFVFLFGSSAGSHEAVRWRRQQHATVFKGHPVDEDSRDDQAVSSLKQKNQIASFGTVRWNWNFETGMSHPRDLAGDTVDRNYSEDSLDGFRTKTGSKRKV